MFENVGNPLGVLLIRFLSPNCLDVFGMGQNCLTVSNIKLDDVFSDVFGKAASAITTRLLESSEPFDVAHIHANFRNDTDGGKGLDTRSRCNEVELREICRSLHQTAARSVCSFRH